MIQNNFFYIILTNSTLNTDYLNPTNEMNKKTAHATDTKNRPSRKRWRISEEFYVNLVQRSH